jgi:hypothetical protein
MPTTGGEPAGISMGLVGLSLEPLVALARQQLHLEKHHR